MTNPGSASADSSRFGLRSRVIAAFGIGALGLSVLLALATYSLTANNLVERRTANAISSALSNARDVNDTISPGTDPARFTGMMRDHVTPEGTVQGIFHDGLPYWESANPDPNSGFIPPALDKALEAGQAAHMTFDTSVEPYLAVGYPLPSAEAGAYYVEATPLGDLEGTLATLRATLVGASVITTILGIGFGVYVGTRLFSPLHGISTAAESIAEGDLSTRLDEVADPDLGPLVSSFNEMTTALENRIERDSRFASDVSHELRSPLMTLTGSVAVLERRRDELTEPAQVALDLLSADIGRFKVLVEDLLEISRFDIGAIEIEREEVMVAEFIRQALHAATSGQRQIPVEHLDGTDEAIATLDKRRIAQVIRNLSENADKYADGLTQVRLRSPGQDLVIELEDHGPGVPAEERELIFERFARGSEGGRRGSSTGVGLGLSLVTEHLRLHGGSIRAQDRSDGDSGACFSITLPDSIVSDDEAPLDGEFDR